MFLKPNQPNLKQKSLQRNLIPKITFAAEALNDPFDEVSVITLNQYLRERAYDNHWNNQLDDFSKLDYQNTGFVQITKTGIQIVLNVPKITDREIDRAVELLFQIDDLSTEKTIVFGKRGNN